MTPPRVVVLGDANVDLVVRLPERGAGAPDVSLSTPRLYGGGTAANVAVALARLGVGASFVGALGDDGYGRWLRDDFARAGVDTRGLRWIEDAFTPMVLALIEPDGERLIVVWPPHGGAHVYLRPEDVDPVWFEGAAWLHTTGMCLRAAPVRQAVLHGMALAREAALPVSLDLSMRLELWDWSRPTRHIFQQAVELADVVLGNGREEIVPLAGVNDVEAAARAVCDGRRVVVARLGAGGALAVTPTGTCHVPAFEVSVVDTLGAGDAFNAGFIAARLDGRPVAEALRWGNAVAALKLGRPSARGTPLRAEVEQWLGQVCSKA